MAPNEPAREAAGYLLSCLTRTTPFLLQQEHGIKEPQTNDMALSLDKVQAFEDSLKQHPPSSPARMPLADEHAAISKAPAVLAAESDIQMETAVEASPNPDSSSEDLIKAEEHLKHSPSSLTTAEMTSMSMDASSESPKTPINPSIFDNDDTKLTSPKKCKRFIVIVVVAIVLAAIIWVATLRSMNRHSSQAPPATQIETGASGTGTSNNGTGNDTNVEDNVEDDTNVDDSVEDDTNVEDNVEDEATPTSIPLGPITYVPGLLNVEENGLLLSEGLTSRLIATRRQPVKYFNGTLSVDPFHRRPDYGACFPVPPDATANQGGWVYVSNSELGGPPSGQGGVGALYFDQDGNIIDYKMLLRNTTTNCAGGRTPWGTFVSCEEVKEIGQIYQVDPFDRRPPERITMGMLGGRYEAFAYDDRDKSTPRFFVTEDLGNGPTLRWTPDPDSLDWDTPWDILTGNGTLEYLFLKPDPADNNSSGTFEWTTNLTRARENAALYARGTEGIDRNDEFLYFVCKANGLFYILNLDLMTFAMYPVSVGLFDGEPDQIKRMVNDTQDILYFSEEGNGDASGIHGRNNKGQFFTILEGPGYEGEETTGLAFSPNGLHMYVAFQDPGVLFDITRADGYPFHGKSLEVRYHNPPLDHLLRP
jgi:hypothetical protein